MLRDRSDAALLPPAALYLLEEDEEELDAWRLQAAQAGERLPRLCTGRACSVHETGASGPVRGLLAARAGAVLAVVYDDLAADLAGLRARAHFLDLEPDRSTS
jgi:hypothetical protein